MAGLPELETALVNADKAGDENAARSIAAEIVRLRGGAPPAAAAPPAVAASAAPSPNGGGAGDALDPVIHGATFGFSPEIAGTIAAGLQAMGFKGKLGDMSPSEAFTAYRDAARGNLDAFRERHPIASAVLEIAGSIPTLAAPGGLVTKAATLGGKVATSAAVGAAAGELAGIGEARGTLAERVKAAGALPAIVGAAGGAVAPALGRGAAYIAGGAAAKNAMLKVAPDADELRTIGNGLYKAVRQAGIAVLPKSADDILQDVIDVGIKAGARAKTTPRTWGAIEELSKEADMIHNSGAAYTLDGLDQLRKVIQTAMPEGSAAAGAMLAKITDRMNGLQASDMLGGQSPQQVTQALSAARSVWHRMAKSEVIASAIANAQNAASGVENGLRAAFRPLLKIKPNGKPAFNWTDDERKAIQAVVKGTPGTNLLRFLGTFGYSADQARSWLGVFAGAGGGLAVGGPVGALAVPVAGTIAKAAASKATERLADVAEGIVNTGGKLPPNAISAQTESLANLLLGTASRAGAAAAAQ